MYEYDNLQITINQTKITKIIIMFNLYKLSQLYIQILRLGRIFFRIILLYKDIFNTSVKDT